ncbi:MAG: hypothetical protein V3U71_02385 [Cocleimonas sp.]
MKDTDFFSANKYIYLPTRKNPKVVLTIDSAVLSKNSFQLYNPFSSKAKTFKKVISFFFNKFNSITRFFWKVEKENKSVFIEYLEEELNLSLISSIYYATAKDKVVLQLQTADAKIVGYLKYPISSIGIEHIETEHKAIKMLSAQGIIQDALLYGYYKGKPYLLLTNLDGKTGLFEKQQIETLLLKFDRGEKYSLTLHPRIINLKNSLIKLEIEDYIPLLEKACQKSQCKYKLVFEHGDFAPWNIVKVNGELTPFDFEYFVEDGLIGFDQIKYYFQIGRLIDKKEASDLITYIFNNIDLDEKEIVLILYLIKELIRNKEENVESSFEIQMLDEVENFNEFRT